MGLRSWVARRRGGGRRARPSGGWLLAASACLMVLAWAGANPPGMSVDEPAHYRKAVGVAHLEIGRTPARYARLPYNTPSMIAWLNRTSRAVAVPPRLRGCNPFRLPLHGRCPYDPGTVYSRPEPPRRETTYVATYPPFVYTVPAVPMRLVEALGGHTTAVLMAGRAAVAVLCLALVIAAGLLLMGLTGRLTDLIGLVLAVSPMVLFLMAELAASGPEVAASVCLLAAALSLTRGSESPPQASDRSTRLGWVALAASGLVLTISRSLGPGWLVVLLALVVALRGRHVVLACFRGHRRAAVVTGVLMAAGTVATAMWTTIVEPHATVRPSTVLSGIGPAFRQLPRVGRHAVGSFGWFDVNLPWPVYALWAGLVIGLVALALGVGSQRERGVLVALVALEVIAAVAVAVLVIRPTSPHFKMQGRYVLPLLVALPLLAGEVVRGHPDRVAALLRGRGETLIGAAMALAVAVHGGAWAANTHHYLHNAKFLEEYPRGWQPIGGWAAWSALVGLALVLAWLAVLSTRAGGARRQAPVREYVRELGGGRTARDGRAEC